VGVDVGAELCKQHELAPLANAGVHLLHVCGSLDPDCLIEFWDAQGGAQTFRLHRPETSRLSSLAISPDGRTFRPWTLTVFNLAGGSFWAASCDNDAGGGPWRASL
jgi:hypothetical protein